MIENKEVSSMNEDNLDVVVSRHAGAHQTNGLYHYILHHQQELFNALDERGYRLEFSLNGSRNAWYLKPYTLLTHNVLFNGFSFTSEHLTIDENAHKNKKGLSPNHYTAMYTHDTQCRVVHAYFDLNGEFKTHGTSVEIEIKEYKMGHRDNFSVIPFNKKQELQIKQQAKKYQSELKLLLDAKMSVYIDAYDASHALNYAFTELLLQPETLGNFNDIQSLLNQYKEKVRLAGLYHGGMGTDGREHFFAIHDMQVMQYHNRLQRLEQKKSKKIMPKKPEAGQNKSLNITKQSITDSKGEVESLLEPFHDQYKRLQAQIEMYNRLLETNSQQFIQEVSYTQLLTLQKELLELALASQSEKIGCKIRESENHLKFLMDEMATFFKMAINKGNLSDVDTLFHTIESHINLRQIYLELLNNIDDKNMFRSTESPEAIKHRKKLIAIANYLHQNSLTYRSVFKIFIELFTSTDSLQLFNFGPLMRAIFNGHEETIRMYLEQGLSPDTPQFILSGYPRAYNCLYCIIFFSQLGLLNSDIEKFTPSIHLLFEFKASFQHNYAGFSVKTKAEISQEEHKLDMNLGLTYGTKLKKKSLANQEKFQTKLQNDDRFYNLFSLALKTIPSDPHYSTIIQALSVHITSADLMTLYYELSSIIHHSLRLDANVEMKFVFRHLLDACIMFESQEEATAYVSAHLQSEKVPDSELDSESESESEIFTMPCSWVMILKSSLPPEVCIHYKNTKCILTQIDKITSQMDRATLRSLSDEIFEEAKALNTNNEKEFAYICFFSGILATLKIPNPEMEDYKRLLNFQYFSMSYRIQNQMSIGGDMAQKIRDQLPETQKQELEQVSSYKGCKMLLARSSQMTILKPMVKTEVFQPLQPHISPT